MHRLSERINTNTEPLLPPIGTRLGRELREYQKEKEAKEAEAARQAKREQDALAKGTKVHPRSNNISNVHNVPSNRTHTSSVANTSVVLKTHSSDAKEQKHAYLMQLYISTIEANKAKEMAKLTGGSNSTAIKDKNSLAGMSIGIQDRSYSIIGDSASSVAGVSSQQGTTRNHFTQQSWNLLQQSHLFLRTPEDDDGSYGARIAKKYYDRLYREYVLADLTGYKLNRVGFRWRTESEVVNGKGQFICGNKKCDCKSKNHISEAEYRDQVWENRRKQIEQYNHNSGGRVGLGRDKKKGTSTSSTETSKWYEPYDSKNKDEKERKRDEKCYELYDKNKDEKDDLLTYQVNFGYVENKIQKQSLVKIRLCTDCAFKLNYFHLKKQRLLKKMAFKEAKKQAKKEEKRRKKRKLEKPIENGDHHVGGDRCSDRSDDDSSDHDGKDDRRKHREDRERRHKREKDHNSSSSEEEVPEINMENDDGMPTADDIAELRKLAVGSEKGDRRKDTQHEGDRRRDDDEIDDLIM